MREFVRIASRRVIGATLEWAMKHAWRRAYIADLSQTMDWSQDTLELAPHSRGFHLVTHQIVAGLPGLAHVRVGLLHLFLQHTSASLSINENADSDVPLDLESSFSAIAPEDFPHRHTCEGPDDMPAHVKSSILGCSLTIPISDGRLCLGTWQGIYLCEHRRRGGKRRIVATIWGDFSEPSTTK